MTQLSTTKYLLFAASSSTFIFAFLTLSLVLTSRNADFPYALSALIYITYLLLLLLLLFSKPHQIVCWYWLDLLPILLILLSVFRQHYTGTSAYPHYGCQCQCQSCGICLLSDWFEQHVLDYNNSDHCQDLPGRSCTLGFQVWCQECRASQFPWEIPWTCRWVKLEKYISSPWLQWCSQKSIDRAWLVVYCRCTVTCQNLHG